VPFFAISCSVFLLAASSLAPEGGQRRPPSKGRHSKFKRASHAAARQTAATFSSLAHGQAKAAGWLPTQ